MSRGIFYAAIETGSEFIVVILLSIITCGIYSIFYWYKFTEDLNTLGRGDGQDSPNYIIVFAQQYYLWNLRFLLVL